MVKEEGVARDVEELAFGGVGRATQRAAGRDRRVEVGQRVQPSFDAVPSTIPYWDVELAFA